MLVANYEYVLFEYVREDLVGLARRRLDSTPTNAEVLIRWGVIRNSPFSFVKLGFWLVVKYFPQAFWREELRYVDLHLWPRWL